MSLTLSKVVKVSYPQEPELGTVVFFESSENERNSPEPIIAISRETDLRWNAFKITENGLVLDAQLSDIEHLMSFYRVDKVVTIDKEDMDTALIRADRSIQGDDSTKYRYDGHQWIKVEPVTSKAIEEDLWLDLCYEHAYTHLVSIVDIQPEETLPASSSGMSSDKVTETYDSWFKKAQSDNQQS